ncbi:MAG: 16S rRNA (cytidine(1402)-2'-O)-methyltransferase [Myxococcales bacterium]|nr:16S rRNA (cytidine(1402)-2'-O)-methyltransferase [Myxococcales bacterium]MDH3485516.1 16S rRNA (cytidine(1402)-2'-O)-methyltransferase [Myxococcales bacterium]
MTGCLSVVATPIGCLDDITLRALRILREADAILAEDTRHTRTLCAKHGIRTPLRSFHEHTDDAKVDRLVEELVAGAYFALVSDAGTPVVSDPGAYLVSRAAEAGVVVEAIPGPSAVVAALSVAGLPMHRFTFEGFLPKSGRERVEALSRISRSQVTTVIFESPYRIHATLEDLGQALKDRRRLALCRELTKVHEQTIRGTVEEVRAALAAPAKGEITLVIEGASGEAVENDVDVGTLVVDWKREGLSTKEMTQRLQTEAGWKRNKAYRAVLEALETDE